MSVRIFKAFVVLCAMAAAWFPNVALAQQQPQAGATLQPYRINAGDTLDIYVWGEDRLQRTIKVLPDGSFAFPLVGRVEAAGRLPKEVEDEISHALASQFRDQVPQVTVSVRDPTGFQFSVIGKVRAPGSFTPGKYVNVLEAIAFAGGMAEFADTANVVILRKTGGKVVALRVRLSPVLKGNPSSGDLTDSLPQLQSGDTVVVP